MTEKATLDSLAPLRGALFYEAIYLRRNWRTYVGFLVPVGMFAFFGGRSFGGTAFNTLGVLTLIFTRNLSTVSRDLSSGVSAIYLRTRASAMTLVASKWLLQFLATVGLIGFLAVVVALSPLRTDVSAGGVASLIWAAGVISITMLGIDLIPKLVQLPFILAVYLLVFLGGDLANHSELLWVGHVVPFLGGGYALNQGLLGKGIPVTLYVALALWVAAGIAICARYFERVILDRL